jgi:hypothetical protein
MAFRIVALGPDAEDRIGRAARQEVLASLVPDRMHPCCEPEESVS